MPFPTLSKKPISCPSEPVNNTISTPFECGYRSTRSRNTKRLFKFEKIKYLLNENDWLSLKQHSDSVKGSIPFLWEHPITAEIFTVLYQSQPVNNIINIGNDLFLYDVEISLIELDKSSSDVTFGGRDTTFGGLDVTW